MPHVIIADANEGRRALLASSIERDGFQVTRTSTLAQAEGTVRATVPEVLLLEEEWPDGNALDVAQALSSDPAVGARTRIVMLARSTAPEMMFAAARAGVAEVLGKPLDMGHLLQQLRAHAEKRMVAPPAQVQMASATGYGDRLRWEPSRLLLRRWTEERGRCPCSGGCSARNDQRERGRGCA